MARHEIHHKVTVDLGVGNGLHGGVIPAFGDIPFMLIPAQLFRRTEMNGIGVDVDRQFQAASTSLAHTAPVLKRVANEQIRRYGGYGLVEVLHLDGGERHLSDISVGSILVHGYPVARAQHVVGSKLHAGNKAEDGVLEDQHYYGSRGSESGKNGSGALVDDDAHHEDKAHDDRQKIKHLIDALERTVAQFLVFAGYFIERMEKLADEEQRHYHYIYIAGLEQHGQHLAAGTEGKGQQGIPYNGRNDAAKGLHDTPVEQIVVPRGLGALGELLHGRHDNVAEKGRAHIRYKTYGKHGRERINPRQDTLGHSGRMAKKVYYVIIKSFHMFLYIYILSGTNLRNNAE